MQVSRNRVFTLCKSLVVTCETLLTIFPLIILSVLYQTFLPQIGRFPKLIAGLSFTNNALFVRVKPFKTALPTNLLIAFFLTKRSYSHFFNENYFLAGILVYLAKRLIYGI